MFLDETLLFADAVLFWIWTTFDGGGFDRARIDEEAALELFKPIDDDDDDDKPELEVDNEVRTVLPVSGWAADSICGIGDILRVLDLSRQFNTAGLLRTRPVEANVIGVCNWVRDAADWEDVGGVCCGRGGDGVPASDSRPPIMTAGAHDASIFRLSVEGTRTCRKLVTVDEERIDVLPFGKLFKDESDPIVVTAGVDAADEPTPTMLWKGISNDSRCFVRTTGRAVLLVKNLLRSKEVAGKILRTLRAGSARSDTVCAGVGVCFGAIATGAGLGGGNDGTTIE